MNIINEAIVHRDRFIEQHNTKRTIVAVNPTKEEWTTSFPHGAAGVYCKSGKVVIGDGNALSHDDILSYAKISQNDEKYRLQLCPTGAWVELWLDNEDWEEEKPTKADILKQIVDQYGETLEQITAEVTPALQKFMGSVPVKVIPLNLEDQGEFFRSDATFIKKCIAELRKIQG